MDLVFTEGERNHCVHQSMYTILGKLGAVRPYLFEKLLLGFILQQNGSVSRQKKKRLVIIFLFFRYVIQFWLQAI